MPFRPSAYAWVLPAFDPAALAVAASALVEAFGFEVVTAEGDGAFVLRLVGPAAAIEAAAAHFDSARGEIEPPEDGERYRLELRCSAPDEDDPRARMEVAPEDDNWAAWSVVGPIAEQLAEGLCGKEITADPAPWIQRELDRDETAAPAQLPFLALRAPSLFPGLATVTPFGRASSVETIERALAEKQTRIALLLQRDPARAEAPRALDDVQPIAIDARILKAVRQESGFVLVLKGIARVHVRELARETVLVAAIDVGGAPLNTYPALRAFARADPLVREEAGTSLLARIDELDAGFVADLVAKASGDSDLAARVLVEIDPSRRAAIVEALLQPA